MNFKDLERLQRRIEKVQQVKKPPTLRMVVIDENTPEPELDQWTLCLKIEGKKEQRGREGPTVSKN